MPKVCIILPVFNAERYLAMALASLLLQTHHNIEVIAIDDGSQDRSLALLQAAAMMDARVTVVSRPNRGLIATLNEALAAADSDFVARMDADDIAYPQRIAVQIQAFDADHALGLLGTHFDTLFARGRIDPAPPALLTAQGERGVFGRFVTALRHPTVMFRRTRLGAARLVYDPAYPCAEDFDLFRRLAEHTRIAQTATPLLAYRLHGESVSARKIAQMTRTHVAILGENIERHYPEAADRRLADICDRLSPETVDTAAQMIRRLDALADKQPVAERAAFRLGVTTTFYFIYAHIVRAGHYALAHRFIDHSHRWHAIRRRERMVLSAARTVPVSPAFALFEQGSGLRRRLRSRPDQDVIPGFAEMTGLAQRIERAAQTNCTINTAA